MHTLHHLVFLLFGSISLCCVSSCVLFQIGCAPWLVLKFSHRACVRDTPPPDAYQDIASTEKPCFSSTWNGHTVDNRKVHAEFREASARRHVTSSQEYHFDNDVPNGSPVQKRLSIYNWNPGPRRGREGATEKQIAGKWHIIALQEAIEYVDHELLTNSVPT